MGCWNGTCGISQLPILSGTKVKTFLMLQSEFAHGIGGAGVCYSTAYFRPWFLPVTAEYNDYGSIDAIQKDWNSEYMLETFQKWLAEGKVKILGDKEAEINSPGIRKFKKLENVFDCVERGALMLKYNAKDFDHKAQKWTSREDWLKIGMFMILEPVFNAMVEEGNRFMNDKNNEYYRSQELEDKNKCLEAINTIRQSGSPTEMEMTLHGMYIDTMLGGLIEEHSAFKHYKSLLCHPTKVTVEEFFSKLDATNRIGLAMTYLRKLWIPQTGQGSQSEELSFNKALSNAMLSHVAAREIETEKWRKEDEANFAKYQAEQAKKKKKAKA